MINISMPKDRISYRVEKINSTPKYGGVYFLFNQHKHLIYIGKTNCFRRRMFQHRRNSAFFTYVAFIKLFRADAELERELYETHAINKYRPYYNKAKLYDPNEVDHRYEDYADTAYELFSVQTELRDIVSDNELWRKNHDDEPDIDGIPLEEWPGDADEFIRIHGGRVLSDMSRLWYLTQERDRLRSRLNYLSFYAN